MSGLRKAKKYDWKDSNLALFGSDTEKSVKKESAETEAMWKLTDNLEGTQTVVFRINKFKVEKVPEKEHGNFFEGDSYIIFHQFKDPVTEIIRMDIHFWIGKYSTQDEYGTAAYKTVELDTYHDDKPVQHREVQGHESSKFKGYFKKICWLKGGYESGFNHVETVEYKLRLLRIARNPPKKNESGKSKKQIEIDQVPNCKASLTEDDCFLLDCGDKIVQINGNKSTADEKFKAKQYAAILQDERTGKSIKMLFIDSAEEAMHEVPDEPNADEVDDEDEIDGPIEDFQPTMYRLSDASGTFEFQLVASGNLKKDELDPQDVFICDFGDEGGCYIWIGRGASKNEKGNAMAYAHRYLGTTQHPCAPVTVVQGGQEPADFTNKFH